MAVAAGLVGCNQEGGTWQKVVVEGVATFDGKKVMNGDIRFIPTVASVGPTVGAEIVEGRYRVTNKGGVPVGTHRVMLRAFDIEGVGHSSGDARGGDLFGSTQPKLVKHSKPSIPVYVVEGYAQFLPPTYNAITGVKIEVTGNDNPQIEDFNMASKESKK